MGKIKGLIMIVLAAALLSSCSDQQNGKIRMLEVKTAVGVDDRYMPVKPTSVFPAGTSKVFCWFSWKEAKKDIKITARWYYVTDDTAILDYSFAIPRKEGSGSVSLSMPQGKALPAGLYRVTLELEGKYLKAVTFKVAEK